MQRDGIIKIPQPLQAEAKVDVNLPPEILTLCRDLHADREAIGWGGMALVGCAVLLTLKHLFKKS